MKLLSQLGALFVLGSAAVPFGCSNDSPQRTKPLSDAAAIEDTGGLFCGSKFCAPKKGIGIEKITPCCTDSNECGLKFPVANKCLPADQAGTANASCGTFPVPDQTLTLTGCCGPNGCGKEDAFLGCIVNTDLGLPAQSCEYDPTNTCSFVNAVTCDGPEDCPGQHCCADVTSGAPGQTGCYDSCTAMETATVFWRELCHAGDTCENSTYSCLTSGSLPPWLLRCFNGFGNPPPTNLDTSAGIVNCGSGVCAKGQKCCAVRDGNTDTGYCADKDTPCKCHPVDGGASAPLPRPDGGNHPAPSDAGSKD